MTAATTTPVAHGDATVIAALTGALRAEAEREHSQYPQYDGYWDTWTVAQVTRRIRTKRGIAFEPGDVVLVCPETRTERVPPARGIAAYEDWEFKTFHTAYSRRNKSNTGGLLPSDLRAITVTD